MESNCGKHRTKTYSHVRQNLPIRSMSIPNQRLPNSIHHNNVVLSINGTSNLRPQPFESAWRSIHKGRTKPNDAAEATRKKAVTIRSNATWSQWRSGRIKKKMSLLLEKRCIARRQWARTRALRPTLPPAQGRGIYTRAAT